MLKKRLKSIPKTHIKILIIVGIAVTAGLVTSGILRFVDKYNQATDLATIAPTRDLIIRAAEATKSDAPIDPKTGDTYFPQARLYIPDTDSFARLTYAYLPYAETGNELSVSSHLVYSRKTSPLYSARNIEELFAGVPALQSCTRGIRLLYAKVDPENPDDELKQTIHLNNGKDLYIYREKACPELDETIETLKSIQAY